MLAGGQSFFRRHLWLSGLLFLLGMATLWVGITYWRIRQQSFRDETRAADVIVVFGAAEYSGRPSPVFRARLDHARDLFQKGIAPVIITTGGAGGDPVYNEGQVGRDYLASRGVPEAGLIAETQGDSTGESAERVASIMQANHMHSAVAVSDGYHIFRIKQMLSEHGFEVYGAPRPNPKPIPRSRRVLITLREIVGYTAWVVGVL